MLSEKKHRIIRKRSGLQHYFYLFLLGGLFDEHVIDHLLVIFEILEQSDNFAKFHFRVHHRQLKCILPYNIVIYGIITISIACGRHIRTRFFRRA